MRQLLIRKRAEKSLAFVLILSSLIAFFPVSADAHAKLLRSNPADGEILRQAPKLIELEFSTELQSAEMSSIIVTDKSGRQVDKNKVAISEDGKKLQTELEELSSGAFTVEWKTLSADDHTIRGEFKFSVSLPAGDKTVLPAAIEEPQLENAQTMPMTHQMPNQESGINPAQSVVRWLSYLVMMMLFGGFAFLLFVVKPTLRELSDSIESRRASIAGVNRFVWLSWLSLGLFVLSAAAGLILQTYAVADTSLTEAISQSKLLEVLTKTSFGFSWMLQIAAAVALGIILYFISDKKQNDESAQLFSSVKTALLWMGFVICGLLLLASSLSGHASAAVKEYPPAIFFNWLHLMAVGIWVGGLFHLVLTLPKSSMVLDESQRTCVLSRTIRLFNRLAVGAAVVISFTGIYNSWIHVDGFSALLNTSYGIVLIIKIMLFLPMLALGGFNSFVLRPRIERQTISSNENQNAESSFYRSVRIEAIIGAFILLLAAILAFLPPARFHEMTNDQMKVPSQIKKDVNE